jgi:hypothetical protein
MIAYGSGSRCIRRGKPEECYVEYPVQKKAKVVATSSVVLYEGVPEKKHLLCGDVSIAREKKISELPNKVRQC